MKRALTFLLIFLAIAAAIFAMVLGLNYTGFKTLYENEEGMAEGSEFVENTYSLKGLAQFIGEHPEFVSITSYNSSDPDSGIFYQQDVPRTMGTTANILLIIEYQRQVAAGIIDPNEEITLEEVQRFSLPEISERNHRKVVEEFIDGTAPLDAAISAMIASSDITVADYLWFRLGEDNLRNLLVELNLTEKSLPLPFSGMYSLINPSLHDTTGLAKMESSEFIKQAIAEAKIIKEDDVYHEEVVNEFDNNRLSLTFMQERDALAYFPQATTKELADLMFHLINDEVLSVEISQNVKEKLRWPLNSSPIARSFDDYGAIYDNRMGLLVGIDFGTSVYDGHTSVQAVFFDRLPVGFWVHMSANHMQEDFQQRLIWDPALFETTLKEIEASND